MGRAGGASVIYRPPVLTQDHPRLRKSPPFFLFSFLFSVLTLSTLVLNFIVFVSLLYLLYSVVVLLLYHRVAMSRVQTPT